jgi:hypothetical protein
MSGADELDALRHELEQFARTEAKQNLETESALDLTIADSLGN